MPNNSTINLSFRVTDGENGLKQLAIDADALRQIMKENVKIAEEFGNSWVGSAALSGSLSAAKDALQGITGLLEEATAESRSFTDAMRAANTMAGKDAAGFEALKGQVAGLANEIPIARDALANGLYQVVSNGVPEDNWIEFLRASARSSIGGIADLGKVVGVTSTIIKNYGLTWDEAASIQDKIQLTAKNGVTSFEQLADALPRVSGNAATLGVSVEELMAAFATLTGVSGNTAEVSTQLAAIFTALVKPSSEATKMAQQMGIEFNAAAIKSAGGMQNFLTQLDRSISQYAESHNVLEQEVYGKLFGSAESLRALIPLTGELSSKFEENVAAMEESTGTMDAAFTDMSDTSEATAQKFANFTAGFRDAIASVTAGMLPFAKFGAGALAAGADIMILYKNIKTFTLAMKGARAAALQLSTGMKTLLISSGIGLAFVAVVTILEAFSGSSDKASQSAEKLAEAQERVKQAEDAGTQAATAAKIQLDEEAAALDRLIKSKKDTSGAVAELNKKYGDFFGQQSTAEQWYQTLISRSKDYVKQIGYEAQMRVWAEKQASVEIRRDELLEEKKKFNRLRTQNQGNSQMLKALNKKEAPLNKQLEEAEAELFEAEQHTARIQKKMDELGAPTVQSTTFGGIDLNESKRQKTELEKLSEAIKKKKDAYVKASEESRPAIAAEIQELERQRTALELLNKEAERPAQIESLRDISKELEYQRALRENATTDEQLRAIDEEIERLERLKQAKESAYTPPPTNEIKTLAELGKATEYYNRQLETGTETERVFAQQNLNDLQKLEEGWRRMLTALDTPVSLSEAFSKADVDKGISYYTEQLQRATGDEALAIQRTIAAWERRREAIDRALEIPGLEEEAREINALTGKEYKLRIQGMGFDGITDKIREIDDQLNDMENPPTEGQRQALEQLRESYVQWRRDSLDTFSVISSEWSSLKGIGSGLSSIQGIVDENATTWERMSGVVDGTLQIYDGVRQVVDLINMLKIATTGAAAAEKVKTAATEEDTLATGVNAAMSESSAAKALANTGAKSGEAIANATASGAKMPFPANLAAIAAGVAAVVASITMISSMKFAGGGIVGGASPSGDRLIARVNSGEMILNTRQQRRLFDLLDGRAGMPRGVTLPTAERIEAAPSWTELRRALTPAGAPVIVGGRLRASGRDIVAVLEAETRLGRKSGRRIDIG